MQSQVGGVITSGGGFSTVFSRPSYQNSSVISYFQGLTTQPAPGFNPQGRGYPDVALLGVSFVVVVAQQFQHLYGTSCAAPVFAGLGMTTFRKSIYRLFWLNSFLIICYLFPLLFWLAVSLINAARASNNQTSLGFLNPTLYSRGQQGGSFNDITSGNNNCCTYTGSNPSSASCCASGFTATVGWDPVTGLGSVYYPKLAELFNVNVTYDASAPDVEPKPFWGIPASVMAIIIVCIIVLAVCYPVGAWFRRKYLPKSDPPSNVHEDYRDCKALYRCTCRLFCPCVEHPEPSPTPAPRSRRARRGSDLQRPLISEEQGQGQDQFTH